MTSTRSAFAEVALYALALWASYEMSKTPDQRIQDRLRTYRTTARVLWWLSRSIATLALELELAYHREVSA